MAKATNKQLVEAASKLLQNYLRLQNDEHVALVTDGFNPRIIKALWEAAKRMGHPLEQVHEVRLDNPNRAGGSPIPEAAEAFAKAHVVIAPTRMSITHSTQS